MEKWKIVGCLALLLLGCSAPEQDSEYFKVATGGQQVSLYEFGRSVYSEQQCATCHLLRGEGGVVGPALDPLAQGMDGTMIREAIIEPNRTVKTGYPPGVMPTDFARRMTDKEMDALIFFITNPLDPPKQH